MAACKWEKRRTGTFNPEAQKMDRDAEIAEINRELKILRDRYALYGRMGRMLKVFFLSMIPVLVIGALVLAVKFFLVDPLYGLFFTGGVLLFGAATYWLISGATIRWIDLASQPPRFANPYTYTTDYPGFGSFFYRRPPSDAETIERQIADRERRLAELGAEER
jgi:hypothetical protein